MILIRLTGGLGNQMFQYALGIALSNMYKQPLFYDTSLLGLNDQNKKNVVIRNFDLDIFPISASICDSKTTAKFNGKVKPNFIDKVVYRLRRILGKYPLVLQKNHGQINFTEKKFKGNLCIVGRWQSENYFKKYKEEVLKEFSWTKFKPNKYSLNLITHSQNDTLVSVQVRRGDYITHPEYSITIGGLTSQYYADAMDKIKSFFDSTVKIKFLVISDDIEWCKQNISKSDEVIFVEQEKSKAGYVSDLWLLSQCKHAIISNSTFAWWGAWMAEKKDSKIITPSQWTRDGKNEPINIIPKRWVRIQNKFESIL